MNCSFGCGNEGKYKLKNGKVCCESYFTKCPTIRDKNSKNQLGKQVTDETKFKQSESHKKRWTGELKKDYSERMKLRYSNNEEREKQRKILTQLWKSIAFRRKHKEGQEKYFKNNSKHTIDHIQNKFKTFSKVEKIRYKPNTNKIQVKCKKCNQWFIPTSGQFYERINQLEHPLGNDGCYFYCSNECKNKCSLYNLKTDIYKIDKKYYTKGEYNIFRRFVLNRDDYKCQYCDEKATDVHHERPQKLEPFFALDPDFAWSCCEKCHYKYGHKDECSTGNLAYKNCI